MPTFYARRDYPEGVVGQIIVADVNGDGIPDMVICPGLGTSYIETMFGNGDGTFRSGPKAKTPLFTIATIALADLNGDGKLDLVASGALPVGGEIEAGVTVSIGNGDGTFQTGTLYQIGPLSFTPVAITGAVLGDFNGDGILDIVTVGQGGVWLLTGQGGGAFNQAVMPVPISSFALTVLGADFRGNNKLDLVITFNGAGFIVLLGNGDGTFQTPISFSQPSTGAVAVGSLTKGGPPSIVLFSSPTLYLYSGNGNGTFSGPQLISDPSDLGGVAVGDVNSDGIPDIVTGGVHILFGLGGGKFSKPVYYTIWGAGTVVSAASPVLADLRNNGRTDIISSGGGVSVLLNQGHGVFEDGIWTKVGGGAVCGVKGDFNRDGHPDLAVNNANGVSILLGTAKYATPFTTGTSIPWQVQDV